MSELFNLKEKFLSFSPFKGKELNKPSKKILLTFFLLFFFKLGTSIPLSSIDNEALKKSFLQIQNTNNSIFQIINMYAGGGGKTLLSPFSLGIIPFINASIVIDLCSALFPALEKLQSDEVGRRQLMLYKKILTIFLSILQSYFLLSTLKSYFYFNDFFHFFIVGLELVTGSLIMVWLTTIIDQKGIGNGTSLIIFTNIMTSLINKNFLTNFEVRDGIFLAILIALICISQMGRITIPIVSARQLAFLESNQKNKRSIQMEAQSSTLLIRFTQAGIFPIIIAANLLPIISYFFGNYQNSKILINFLYYGAIILFNYFYTTVFWDPEKISEQLRKSSVSIVNITPGRQTVKYLENVVRTSSILGGIFLCFILSFYDLLKQVLNSYFLNQISISSLIILVGVIYELQKTIRGMYKTII
jgi:preprotein translocase subunit SecY